MKNKPTILRYAQEYRKCSRTFAECARFWLTRDIEKFREMAQKAMAARRASNKFFAQI